MVVDREAEIDHYAFVIEYGKHRVFVSGDLEMDDEITEALCNHGLYDAVFVNPVIPQKKPWFENLMKINASMRYVYHLPSEENDRFFYRKAAMRMAKKHGKYKLLLDKMKKLNS